jgi:hypothetical protein
LQTGGEEYERVSIGVKASEWHSKWTQWPVEQGGNGHWYQVFWSPEAITWSAAFTNAQLAGGYLATITSEAENEFAFQLTKSRSYWRGEYNDLGPFFGGYQPPDPANTTDGWSWVTGESWNYANWAPGQPDGNGPSVASGIHFWGEAWNDLATDSAAIVSYVVEREIAPMEQERSRNQRGSRKR